jgi:hypothetical protein
VEQDWNAMVGADGDDLSNEGGEGMGVIGRCGSPSTLGEKREAESHRKKRTHDYIL